MKKTTKQGIAGIGFLIVGTYMVLILNNLNGLILSVIGMGILLWKFR